MIIMKIKMNENSGNWYFQLRKERTTEQAIPIIPDITKGRKLIIKPVNVVPIPIINTITNKIGNV